MSRRIHRILISSALLVIILSGTLVLQNREIAAQDDPITVTRTEPGQFTNGQQAGVLSVFGTNFTEGTTVRLVGVGLLEVTFVNSGALTAVLSPDLPLGTYGIEVSSPDGGTATSPNQLRVVTPPPPTGIPPTALPPTDIPTAIPTALPPTIVPGQPSLVVRDFAAIPSVILPGGPVALTFVIVNQGNRAALGASVAIDSGGKFVPANGQAGVTLPDMPPGSSVQVTLNALAARDATEGPTTIPLTMSYRDFEGTALTSKADLSVEIAQLNESTQVTMIGYEIDPQPAVPGEAVTIHVTVSNSGNEAATRALLRVSGDTNILLAGRQGDSFPLGDIAPGAQVSIDMPMIVSPGAEAGPQSQSLTISYIQDGETKQVTSSMTITVDQVIKPEPVLLLDSYDSGDQDVLHPGDRFTFSLTLRNVGQASAPGVLVTFGDVDAPSSGDSGSGTGTGGSSTTPSSAFAPLGGGDTRFLGTLAADEDISLEQDFIVDSSVSSGIYSLPITVRYQKSDGTLDQQNLRASLIVLAPPRIQTDLESPLPEQINVGEPYPVALKISNRGTSTFDLSSARVSAENAEVVDGAEVLLAPIKTEDDDTVTALIVPSEEGTYTVTFELTYTDDLNREQTLQYSYEGEAVTPPPPPEMPPEVEQPQSEAVEEDNLLGRLLLGFFGLGG